MFDVRHRFNHSPQFLQQQSLFHLLPLPIGREWAERFKLLEHLRTEVCRNRIELNERGVVTIELVRRGEQLAAFAAIFRQTGLVERTFGGGQFCCRKRLPKRDRLKPVGLIRDEQPGQPAKHQQRDRDKRRTLSKRHLTKQLDKLPSDAGQDIHESADERERTTPRGNDATSG